jgi:AraC family transcriptional regulator
VLHCTNSGKGWLAVGTYAMLASAAGGDVHMAAQGSLRKDYQVEGRLDSQHMRAEIRSYFWPDTEEGLMNFDEYQMGRMWPPPCGSVLGRLNDSKKPCIFGELSLIAPGLPLIVRRPQGRWRVFACAFQPAFFEDVTGVQGDWDEDELRRQFDLKSTNIAALMERLHCEVRDPGLASGLFIESAGNLLLVELTRFLDRRGRTGEAKRGGLANWQLRRIYDRTAAMFETTIPTIRELAELCGVSADHLMRMFKKTTGTTIHKYIEDMRLAKAKSLLTEGDLSVKEISFQLGFSSQGYFCSAFRKRAAMSPSSYRQLVRCG